MHVLQGSFSVFLTVWGKPLCELYVDELSFKDQRRCSFSVDLILVLSMTFFNKGAYFDINAIYHKAINLCEFDWDITLEFRSYCCCCCCRFPLLTMMLLMTLVYVLVDLILVYTEPTHNWTVHLYMSWSNYSQQRTSLRDKFYKFIQNTVGHYFHAYTNLHTINKQTYQDQYRIKYLSKYRSKLYHFTA